MSEDDVGFDRAPAVPAIAVAQPLAGRPRLILGLVGFFARR
jgi:hypothetical protein